MIFIPQKLLDDEAANGILVQILENLRFVYRNIECVTTAPTDLPDEPSILYDMVTKKIWVSDTESWTEFSGDLGGVYTQAEVNALLALKAALAHIHTESDISNLNKYTKGQVRALLAEKSESDHTHTTFAGLTLTEPLVLTGDGRVWKCLDLAPGTIGHPSTNPPDSDDHQGLVFDLFDDGTEEQVFHKWNVPHDFAVGTASIRGHFGLMVDNPQGGSDEYVAMGFEWTKISPGDVVDISTPDGGGAIDIKIVDGESAYAWHESAEGMVDTTGFQPGDVIMFRFFRDVAGTYSANDDYTGDAWVGIYHLEYLSDVIGEAS